MKPNLQETYQKRVSTILSPIAEGLEAIIKEHLSGTSRIDRIEVRVKSPDRFLAKSRRTVDGRPKYSDPLSEIQDQIGVRIVVLYEQDVSEVCKVIEKYYHPFEKRLLVPEKEWEFGYFGRHYILSLPSDAVPSGIPLADAPDCFELQVRTLWQHAWSEANHDLGYKPAEELSADQRRRLAYTSAQAWGADRMFSELFDELRSIASD
ncbi:MAG TPA: RelA/SpoT domain-containing protein [Nitrospira sp.]|jgi:ppGpp synthetase/RelA/SpoT-type nucleotidyltranferase|nr:RelA/SpoT domain-containing protein [Nitrospira sp.]